MDVGSKIFVAGHRGLVGSAIVRRLRTGGHANIIVRSRDELDLTDAVATDAFFAAERPEYVFLAAAKVGGIWANNQYPADFIRENLRIQTNVIDAAHRHGVDRLLFLGSSCIYPKHAPQPIKETALLTGALETTNRAYAIAKISGIEMCWSYNRQHGTRYLSAMPTNLYGPGDNYHPDNSHVIPALLRKFHEAQEAEAPSVTVWGTGKPRREFLYSDDMADACVFLMNLDDARFATLLGSPSDEEFNPPLINVGSGVDVTIAELAQMVADATGFRGEMLFDTTKPDGTPRKLMDSSRLHALGWRPSIDLREGLRRALADFLSRCREM